MIKIVICEDDEIFRDTLKEYLNIILEEETNQFEIIEFNCGEDLIENYPECIDIFFLDIDMKYLTGMDVARKIREVDDNCEIIFTTGLIDYIQDGYEVRAYRYLLKPIEFQKLKKNINECIKNIRRKNKNKLIIQIKGEVHNIKIDEIMFVEIINKDIMIHTKKQVYSKKTSMKNIEKELNRYNFYRCHKGFLVNINHVESIRKSSILINGTELPVSRYKMKGLKMKLISTMGDIIC